jgi:ABC-type sugar transport system permease subunit
MIAIPMILFLILQIGSVFYAIFISLWDWNVRSGPEEFEGLANYEGLLTDPIFHRAIQNSLYYAAVWVPLTMVIGLFLAIIVNQKIRGRTFFRAAYYFPAIASSAAITILWIFIVSPQGLFNTVREAMGLNPLFELFGFDANHNWIFDQGTALSQ